MIEHSEYTGIDIHRLRLLEKFSVKTADEWHAKYPKLSQRNIEDILEEIQIRIKKGKKIHSAESYEDLEVTYSKQVRIKINDKLSLIAKRSLYLRSEKAFIECRKNFPVSTGMIDEEIRATLEEAAAALETGLNIFVHEKYMGKVYLERQLLSLAHEHQRDSYNYQLDHARSETEVDLTLTELLRMLRTSPIFMTPALFCAFCSLCSSIVMATAPEQNAAKIPVPLALVILGSLTAMGLAVKKLKSDQAT